MKGKKDVYVLRVGGWNPTNLTAVLAGDHGEPAFSPDDRFIAFRSESSGAGVFLMEATGESVRRLTDFGHTHAWFPDGQRIVVSTVSWTDPSSLQVGGQLWIVDSGTGARRKLPFAGFAACQPSVSPHGLRIAFWGIPPGGGRRDIYTIGTGDPATDAATPVTNDASLDWSPFWSGDGRFLYFASDRNGTMNLWRVEIDEASGRVRGEPEPVMLPASWAGFVRGTSDGSRVVFQAVDWDSSLERLPFDPVGERASGPPVPVARFVGRMEGPRLSPQGGLMTLSSYGGKEDILVLKSDGTGLRRLTDDGFRNRGPTVSPDGRKILFYSDRGGGYDAWTVDVDGIGLSPVTRSRVGNTLVSPVWSPDGKTIAAGGVDGQRLLLLPYPRSPEDPLPAPAPPPGEGLGCNPRSWSPDSRRVAATALRANGSPAGVLVYDVDKRSYRRVTETGSEPVFLRDGRRIAFQDGNVLKIVDTGSGRTREILRGDERRVLSSFALSPDDEDLFVIWSVTQADLWLMDLRPRK